ncbi:hypothetical protein BG015_008312 [Linnemannia schmuckeri]|uniref:Uncharacterized protein n=1 Tax=Linnemannia schmuckeri TaxID=64567 RepID=A0A9P5VAL5_9FUNG|nr:hypothetical protein BG015_008312 [Linnemannia schmuckeri]
MRLTAAFLAVFLATVSTIKAQDDQIEFGICTCFRPDYDASCCILGKGSMTTGENVCDTLDFGPSVKAYEDCCIKSGGKHKCKIGYRDPKTPWPPEGSYSCSSP